MQFLKVTRQATPKLTPKAAPRAIPMTDPKMPPQTAPNPDEMVEFMVGEYINRAKLKALLDELFPGKWSAKVRIHGHQPSGFAHSQSYN